MTPRINKHAKEYGTVARAFKDNAWKALRSFGYITKCAKILSKNRHVVVVKGSMRCGAKSTDTNMTLPRSRLLLRKVHGDSYLICMPLWLWVSRYNDGYRL